MVTSDSVAPFFEGGEEESVPKIESCSSIKVASFSAMTRRSLRPWMLLLAMSGHHTSTLFFVGKSITTPLFCICLRFSVGFESDTIAPI